MKRSILLGALGALLSFVVSCQKTPTAELSVSQNEYTVQASGGSVNVSVSSNVDLTVRISAGWITQAGGPSSGGGTYSFTVAHNDGYDARTATITFSNGEQGVSETVTITQSQQDAIIPGSLEYQLFYEAQTFSLPVSANVDCSVSVSGGDWIKSLGTRGLTTKQYQFSIAENTSKTPREAVVTITSGSLKQSIKVEQLPTTHSPETKEDWDKSVDISYAIYQVIDTIVESFGDGSLDGQAIKNKLSTNEDIIEVVVFESSVAVMQRDSIWLNYSLKSPEDGALSMADYPISEWKSSQGKSRSSIESRAFVSSGKAYIYAPFQYSFKKSLNRWKDCLLDNFDEVVVRKRDEDGDDASIWNLIDDLSTHYDFLVFDTHGTEGHNLKTESNPFASQAMLDPTIILMTSTPYSKETVKKLVDAGIDKKQLAQDKTPNGSTPYICFTTNFINRYRFDNSCVILSACESAKRMDYTEKDDKGSMVGAFINRGASIVTGAKVSMKVSMLGPTVTHMIELMTLGCSFKNAFKYVARGDKIAHWRDVAYKYDTSGDPFIEFDINNQYIYETRESNSDEFFFVNPTPELNNPEEKNGLISFSWKSNLSRFPIDLPWEDSINDRNSIVYRPYNYVLEYSLYVDGTPLAKSVFGNNDNTDTKASWKPKSKGQHSWYVVARIKQGDEEIAAYKSKEEKFEVKGEVVSVTGIRVSPSTLTLEEGQTSQLKATVYPTNATNQKVIWTSNYPENVSVDETGLVTAIKRRLGVAYVTITAKTEDGGKISTCYVTVKESSAGKVAVTGISLGQSSAELKVGDVLQLNAMVAPSNATNKTVTWSSSNNSVATVSSSGLVSAKAEGTAKITAKTEDGGKTATVTITVKKADGGSVSVTGVSLDKSSISLKVGESETLKATVSPANATNKGLTWTSSMSSVATVTSDGVVTAKAAGTATITVKTDDGGKTATCNVTVTYNGDPGGEISVSQVTISPTTANMTVGDTKQFSVKIDPANATNQDVSWSSSEPSVASVDSKGMVTAKAEGKATITVTAKDGGVSSKATVTVSNKVVPVTGVTVSPTSLTMEIGDSKSLTVTVNPSDATDKTYTVSSDNTGVVEIDKNNNVVAKGAGTANVKVTTTDGAQTATCKVTVNKPQMTIEASPTSLSFGEVNVGESSAKTFTISNAGKAEVKVSGISVPTAFGTDASTPFTIAVGKSQTVTVTFNPTDGKDYSGTITITSDADSQPTVSVSGKGVKQSSSETLEAVDMGLSVKWANMNLGATKPEEYGKYYAWGETKGRGEEDVTNLTNHQYYIYYKDSTDTYIKVIYSYDTYKWYTFPNDGAITKYTSYSYGVCLEAVDGKCTKTFHDDKTQLDPEDDAAHVNLGGKWRMPTYKEAEELFSSENCTFSFPSENGSNLIIVTSKKTGKSISFPQASITGGNSGWAYWTSTLYEYNHKRAKYFWSNGGDPFRISDYPRHVGMPIRPVSD